jgi:hypothetical protein
MNLSTERGNALVDAYSLVRRSGFLQTSLGRCLFKSAYFLYRRYFEDDLIEMGLDPSKLIDFFVERDFKIYVVHPPGKLSPGLSHAMNHSGYVDLLLSRRPHCMRS